MLLHHTMASKRKSSSGTGVYNQWTGLVDWTSGLDWWTGPVDWTTELKFDHKLSTVCGHKNFSD